MNSQDPFYTQLISMDNLKECSNNTIEGNDPPEESRIVGGASSRGEISPACFALNTFGSKKAKKVLPQDFQPNEYTVILGRGACSDSAGNRHLKFVVQSYLQQYLDAQDKLGKSLIVSTVFDIVKEASPVAAFVKYDNSSGRWVDVGERTSREKIGSMFRDCLSDRYKSSAKNKTAIRAQKKKAKSQPSTEEKEDNMKPPPASAGTYPP